MNLSAEEKKSDQEISQVFRNKNKGSLGSVDQLQIELDKIEKILITKSKVLEEAVSCSSLKEDEPDETPSSKGFLFETINRIYLALRRHNRAEEISIKRGNDLQEQLKQHQIILEEIQMERDVLLERVHAYLEMNSNLRVRLEEQRCQSAARQRHLDTDLESQVRKLESNNKKLSDLIIEKDKEINKIKGILEQTRKFQQIKEMEVLNCKNVDISSTATLKKDFEKVLKDNIRLEEKCRKLKEESFFGKSGDHKKIRLPKRSKSVEDLTFQLAPFNSSSTSSNSVTTQIYKPRLLNLREESSKRPFALVSTANLSERSLKEGLSHRMQKSSEKKKEIEKPLENKKEEKSKPSLHIQELNSLTYGLANVTEKLKALKIQLKNSKESAITKGTTKLCGRERNLKRKGEPIEDSESNDKTNEEPNSEFKNLKDILENAKNLNAKLQYLREEKQRANDTCRNENVDVDEGRTKCDKCCQTAFGEKNQALAIFRHFQNTIVKLKKDVGDWEEKLQAGVDNKDEAFASLVSAFSVCILSNMRYFHESEKRALSSLKEKTDTNLLMDEGSNKAREPRSREKEAAESGGGDNLLKNSEGKACKELKFQIARLKCKMEHFPKFSE